MRWFLLFLLGSLIIIIGGGIYLTNRQSSVTPSEIKSNVIKEVDSKDYKWQIEVIARNLEVPWDMGLSDNQDLFITERLGKVKLLKSNGQLINIATLDNVYSQGESGLTGIALHPNFSTNNLLYLYYSYQNNGQVLNRVSQFTFEKNSLKDEKVILDNLPGGLIHNGGRLRFGPDGKLWVLTGDAGNENLAQSLSSLGGKVLRLNDDGSIPDDNPLKNSAIYSYGHRNPQGLDWSPEGRELYISEHGSSNFDEINIVKANQNYGWPQVSRCFSDDPRFQNPILCSEETTWAPSGLAFLKTDLPKYKNSFIFAGLRGQILERVKVENGKVVEQETIIREEYGRLRGVLSDEKGSIYISTSNKDGRGTIKGGDDKILKITLRKK